MKFAAIAALISFVNATDVAVGGECKKPDGGSRPVCAG